MWGNNPNALTVDSEVIAVVGGGGGGPSVNFDTEGIPGENTYERFSVTSVPACLGWLFVRAQVLSP